jgi:hypothetical protein
MALNILLLRVGVVAVELMWVVAVVLAAIAQQADLY